MPYFSVLGMLKYDSLVGQLNRLTPPPGVVYSICITDVWAAGGKSYSCVNRLLNNFDQFLPRPKQQRIGTHRCLPPLWWYTDVRCQVHLCKVIQCSCIIGRLPVGGWLPGPEDYVATACITGWLPWTENCVTATTDQVNGCQGWRGGMAMLIDAHNATRQDSTWNSGNEETSQ